MARAEVTQLYVEPERDNSAAPAAQPVLDYQDPGSANAERARGAWRELLDWLGTAAPGCLVVAAVIIILFVYAMIAIAVLSNS